MKPNRNYKDSVFTHYFNDREKLIEVYSAVTGEDVPADVVVDINTLEDVLYKDQMNDISFLLGGKQIVLIESQASWNPNMPLRLLEYTGRLYEKIIPRERVYGTRLIELPAPNFILLYSGKAEFPDRLHLKLSDSFITTPSQGTLELTATMYNVNHGHNEDILNRSRSLSDYTTLIEAVRDFESRGLPLAIAIRKGVEYCIDKGIMPGYLSKHASEVRNMLIYEYDREMDIKVNRDEAYTTGRDEGLAMGRTGAAKRMKSDKVDASLISKYTGLSIDEIEAL